jgi:hypothetical protein
MSAPKIVHCAPDGSCTYRELLMPLAKSISSGAPSEDILTAVWACPDFVDRFIARCAATGDGAVRVVSRSQTSFALRRRARLTPLASTCRPSRLRQGSRRATVASSGQAGGEGTPDERHLLTIGAANCGTQAAR